MDVDVIEAAISAKGTSKESISTEYVLSIVDKVALQILDQNLTKKTCLLEGWVLRHCIPA